MKILLFTPTIPSRQADAFLDPCREYRRQLANHYGIKRMEDATHGERLGEKNERARQWAVKNGYTHLLYLEDDEAANLSMLEEMIQCAEKYDSKLVMAAIAMRMKATKTPAPMWVPIIWNFEHPFPAHNDRIMSVTQVHKNMDNRTPIKIDGGAVCSPMLMNLDLGLPFHGGPNYADPTDQECWDWNFSKELHDRFIPFYCLNWIPTKHYCSDTHEVYE